MRTHRCRGVTIIEVIVLVFVIAVLLAIAVSVVQSPPVDGRRTQCANNMRNLGLALINYQTSTNRLPNAGTFFDDPARHQGDPLKSNIYRALTDCPARRAKGRPGPGSGAGLSISCHTSTPRTFTTPGTRAAHIYP